MLMLQPTFGTICDDISLLFQ